MGTAEEKRYCVKAWKNLVLSFVCNSKQGHAVKVSKLPHFDTLHIGESFLGHEYALTMKDDFPGYVFLRPSRKVDASTPDTIPLDYFTTFVPVLKLFSDQGPQFCNEAIKNLAPSLDMLHCFSTVYVPWSTGTVEAVCTKVLCIMRVLSTGSRVQ